MHLLYVRTSIWKSYLLKPKVECFCTSQSSGGSMSTICWQGNILSSKPNFLSSKVILNVCIILFTFLSVQRKGIRGSGHCSILCLIGKTFCYNFYASEITIVIELHLERNNSYNSYFLSSNLSFATNSCVTLSKWMNPFFLSFPTHNAVNVWISIARMKYINTYIEIQDLEDSLAHI